MWYANAFILNNILAGKVYKYTTDSFQDLPIEVLLGTAIHDTNNKTAWKYETICDGYDYFDMIYPVLLDEESDDQIKSFNEERYNKFLAKMKELGVNF